MPNNPKCPYCEARNIKHQVIMDGGGLTEEGNVIKYQCSNGHRYEVLMVNGEVVKKVLIEE
jgi:hypothetical protein